MNSNKSPYEVISDICPHEAPTKNTKFRHFGRLLVAVGRLWIIWMAVGYVVLACSANGDSAVCAMLRVSNKPSAIFLSGVLSLSALLIILASFGNLVRLGRGFGIVFSAICALAVSMELIANQLTRASFFHWFVPELLSICAALILVVGTKRGQGVPG